MSELEDALIDALWAAPDDPGPREIYADWLTERDEARARFFRADLRFAALSPGDADYDEAWEALAHARTGIDPAWIRRAACHYDVVLERFESDNKIAAIKLVREVTDFGLKAAKDLVEAAPASVLRELDGALAEAVHRHLECELYLRSPATSSTLRRSRERPDPIGPEPLARHVRFGLGPEVNREAVAATVARVLGIGQPEAVAILEERPEDLTAGLPLLESLLAGHRLHHLLPRDVGPT